MSETTTKKTSKPKAQTRYFVMNPAGAVHEVSKQHAQERLALPGWRKPTKTQVEQYLSQRVQRFDDPIGEPFAAEPDGFEIEE